jgi:hypothetical protein
MEREVVTLVQQLMAVGLIRTMTSADADVKPTV